MAVFEDDMLRSRKLNPAGDRGPTNSDRIPSISGPKTALSVLQLQRLAGNGGVAQLLRGDEDLQAVKRGVSGGGAPLDTSTRVQMEQSLGADLSSVRVHTDNDAADSAKDMGAHAYTVGDDVVFGQGKYDPASESGQKTLAHELTHVVQQRSGPVDGSPTGGGINLSDPNDRFEQAAESNAESIVAGQRVESTQPATGAGAAVQREGEEEEVQALAIQREGEEEEEVQALAIQREGEEEEEMSS